MKYKYRIITGIRDYGDEVFIAQFRPVWFPFWISMGGYPEERWAIEAVEKEKKKDAFKSRVIRLG